MANDLTSSSGPVWLPKVCYLLPVPSKPRGLTVSIDRLADDLQAATLDLDRGNSFATGRAELLSEVSRRGALDESPPPEDQSSCCQNAVEGNGGDCERAASGKRNSALIEGASSLCLRASQTLAGCHGLDSSGGKVQATMQVASRTK